MARTISIEVPDDEYARLEAKARLRGVPVAQLARERLVEGAESPAGPEVAAHDALVEAGLLAETDRPAFDEQAFRAWRPIPVTGRPVSETLIEDRR